MKTHVDLFSGIGGFALAARWAGIETVQFVEMDPFCQKVLKKQFPGVPIHGDIYTYRPSERPTIVTAGFPCQPFSTAKHGKRSRVEDFSEVVTTFIGKIGPQYAVVENVNRNIIEWVAERLRNGGYGAICRRYSAENFGAWHKRNRWFAIAYPNDKGEFSGNFDAKMAVVQGMENRFWWKPNYSRTIRVDDGVPNRVDRLKSLGNAIVPQVACQIMRAIIESMDDAETI